MSGHRRALSSEPPLVRLTLILLAVGLTVLFILLPLAAVFVQAFNKGWGVWKAAVTEENARAAIWLSLLVTGISVPLNLIFGVVAAWTIARFRFKCRNLLLTLIDIPFGVSPVVSGLIFVLVFGAQGWLGPWLSGHDIQIIFAVPGIVLATTFVTFPFIARELIPLMQAQGSDEEEAAIVLGATAWQMFRRVTLPNIKWGLLYGVVLCTARARWASSAPCRSSRAIFAGADKHDSPLHVEISLQRIQLHGRVCRGLVAQRSVQSLPCS